MNRLICICAVLTLTALSCTKDKTPYPLESANEIINEEFKELMSWQQDGYTLKLFTADTELRAGYNAVALSISDINGEPVEVVDELRIVPILTNSEKLRIVGPFGKDMLYDTQKSWYWADLFFLQRSENEDFWALQVDFKRDGKLFHSVQSVEVGKQKHKNLNYLQFVGNDSLSYFLALKSPKDPSIGENDIVAALYSCSKDGLAQSSSLPFISYNYAYTAADGYTLKIDPRMPEPSMGNHSSPNNKDLLQQADALYHGLVNYTMSGGWTLNYMLFNSKGLLIKGTQVPPDFTPGVPGVKSQLYMDILF